MTWCMRSAEDGQGTCLDRNVDHPSGKTQPTFRHPDDIRQPEDLRDAGLLHVHLLTEENKMRHHVMTFRCCIAPVTAAAGLLAVVGLGTPLAAQSDSSGSALRLTLAAGPAVTVGTLRSTSRVGYVLEGSVAAIAPTSMWGLRGDIMYQYVGSFGSHMRTNGDGAYRIDGEAVSSAAVFVNALAVKRRGGAVFAYAVGGVGIGLPDAMSMRSGGEVSRGNAGIAWQGGAGVEWPFGRRALSAETRLQSLRSSYSGSWYTTLPITFRVTF